MPVLVPKGETKKSKKRSARTGRSEQPAKRRKKIRGTARGQIFRSGEHKGKSFTYVQKNDFKYTMEAMNKLKDGKAKGQVKIFATWVAANDQSVEGFCSSAEKLHKALAKTSMRVPSEVWAIIAGYATVLPNSCRGSIRLETVRPLAYSEVRCPLKSRGVFRTADGTGKARFYFDDEGLIRRGHCWRCRGEVELKRSPRYIKAVLSLLPPQHIYDRNGYSSRRQP